MVLVDLVPAVHVAEHYEFGHARTDDVGVVGGGVGAQDLLFGYVKGVGTAAGYVVGWHHQRVEVLFGCDDWADVIEYLS